MRIDSQMIRTIELLRWKPLMYEYQHPIESIERALHYGYVEASEPRQEFINGRWRSVRVVTVAQARS